MSVRFVSQFFFYFRSILALAMIDVPSVIVSAIVTYRIGDLNSTPLPESNILYAYAIGLILTSSFKLALSCIFGLHNLRSSSDELLQTVARSSLFMGTMMLPQLYFSTSILVREEELASNVSTATVDIFEHYNDSGFAIIQRKFQCCGLGGSDFWREILDNMPTSCCDPLSHMCTVDVAYAEGCLEKTVDYFVEQIRLIGWITIGSGIIGNGVLVLLLLLCITCATAIASHLKQSTREEHETKTYFADESV